MIPVKFLLFIGILFSVASFAKEEKPPVGKEPLHDKSGLEWALLATDIFLSERIDSLAENMDMFFAGRRMTNAKNPTSVRVTNSSFSREGDGFRNSTHFGVNLRLPNFEKSWQLRFTTYDENEDERGVRSNTLRSTPRRENYGTSLVFLKQLGKIRTTFRPRIELKDPLNVSHVLRFDSSAKSKYFIFNPRVEFFARPAKGTGVFTIQNFDFPLKNRRMLTWINEAEYEDGANRFSTDNGISYSHPVSDKASFNHSLLFSCNNRETYHLEGFSLATVWSQLIYREILDYQLVPQWNFPKREAFKGYVGINLYINIIF